MKKICGIEDKIKGIIQQIEGLREEGAGQMIGRPV